MQERRAGGGGGTAGDAKARVEQHRFSRFYAASYVCDRCYAVAPYKKVQHMWPLEYGTASPQAPWRSTLMSDNDYLASDPRSHWIVVPGFALCRALRDLMHDFHQGCGVKLSIAATSVRSGCTLQGGSRRCSAASCAPRGHVVVVSRGS